MSSLVPDGWAIKPLVELASVDRESLKNSTQPDYKFWYIDIASVKTGAVSVPAEPMVFSDSPSRARKRVCKGDVLMSTVRPNLQSFAYFDKDGDDYIASTGFAVITAKPSSNGKFIYQSILADDVTRQIAGLVAGSNYPAISSLNVKNLELLAPPLPEQQKIAAILSTVDGVIEKTRAQIDKLKDLKTGMMQELLTKGIGHTEFKDSPVGRIPVGWGTDTIGNIAKFSSGGTPDRQNAGYWNGDVPWVKTGEINYKLICDTEEKITEAGVRGSSAKMIPSGAILMAMYGQGITRGKVAKLGIDATVNQACLAMITNSRVNNDFLYYFLSREYQNLRSLVQEGAQKNLSSGIVKEILLPIPPIEEQIAIVGALHSVDVKIQLVIDRLKCRETIKKALMQDLLTGKVRVKINDKEPAVA